MWKLVGGRVSVGVHEVTVARMRCCADLDVFFKAALACGIQFSDDFWSEFNFAKEARKSAKCTLKSFVWRSLRHPFP